MIHPLVFLRRLSYEINEMGSIQLKRSPDATGLGCDIARVMFDFGLNIVHGDFSTDGQWSFLMFRVRVPPHIRCYWSLLKKRLEVICPSTRYVIPKPLSAPQVFFIMQVEAGDRFGLLHDVMQALWEREMCVHRAHVTTSPANTAVDLFYVSDTRNELPNEERQAEVGEYVQKFLGATTFSLSLISLS
jgi:UTP:GlnB (protein PII) uridylyltransferase